MAKANKNSSSKTNEKIDELHEEAISLDEPETVELDLDQSLDFELDTEDLEARIAEVSQEILPDAKGVDKSLPSERISAAAASTNNDPITGQALPLPANDEHNSEINALLYSISNRPSSYVFVWASLFTIVWLAACAFVGYYTIYDTLPANLTISSLANNQPALLFTAGILISLLVIWSCAILVRRSQDMKYSTNLMLSAAKQLLQPESVAIDSVSAVGTAVRREVAAIGEGVERAIARAGELEYMVQNEVLNIERSYGDSETKLKRLVSEISTERQGIIEHADKLHNAITQTKSTLASDLENVTSHIDAAVRQTTDTQMKEMSDSVISAGQVVAKLLETRTASFQKASSLIEERMDAGQQALEGTINSKTADMTAAFDMAQKNMLVEFSRQGETATKNLEDSISIRAREFSDRIAESGDLIQTNIGSKFAQIDSSMTTIGEKLVSSLGMRAEELDKLLTDKTETMDTSISLKLSGFNESLTGHIDTSIDKLSSSASKMMENTKNAEEIILQRTASVEETLKKSTLDFASSVGENLGAIKMQADDLENKLSDAHGQITTSISDGITGITDVMADKNTELAQNFAAYNEGLNEHLAQHGNAVREQLSESNSGIKQFFEAEKVELKSTIEDSTEKLQSAVTGLSESISDKEATITNVLNNSITTVEKQLIAGSQILESNLDKGKTELLGTLSKAVAESRQMIDESTNGLSSTLSERIGEMSSQLDYKTAQFNRLLSERASELTNIIDTQASPIAGNLESVSAVISERLTGISETVGNNTATLFSNLENTKDVLERLTNESATNLSSMRDNLVYQAEQFSSLIGQSQDAMATSSTISENIYAKLRDASESVLEGMQEITNRVEIQGNNLQEATRIIDQSQSNFETTVDNKQSILQELSSSINHRSDELNKAMESFSSVMGSLVNQVSETSQNLSGSVNADITATIEDATTRFNETVQSMRTAAFDIRKELDETREEMRRGVLELPEETSRSADAMRKVVSDQISALKDLTNIIEESGEMLDSKPTKKQETTAAASQKIERPSPVLRAPSMRSAPLPSMPAVEPVSQPTAPLRSEIPPASTTRRNTFPEPRGPQARQTSDSDGWVSDLLKRASKEPDNQGPIPRRNSNRSAAPSMKNLAADIPKALDTSVIADLWNRYRDGENNLFSRGLYSGNGQVLFDQIVRNYTENEEFKSGVDGYIGDFEARLNDANQKGASDETINGYLTSDQGKIYTMLAHAAGRYL